MLHEHFSLVRHGNGAVHPAEEQHVVRKQDPAFVAADVLKGLN